MRNNLELNAKSLVKKGFRKLRYSVLFSQRERKWGKPEMIVDQERQIIALRSEE